MSGIGGVGGAGGIDRVMQLRAQILERNEALQRATSGAAAPATAPVGQPAGPASFTETFETAFQQVNGAQHRASELSAAYERGETVDIAKVMLARQEASVGFEATLQVRNKLLTAYRDIMSMPV
ncbi:flagellar hook-basal body complex protein FliE [Sphingomonas koreensis]|jgi:flagellar hook-basal body complex protein FliE|uniref:Flagellar hook-basal body complex protein FliE n=1 Tax=Sphingomonas koreensis TaxID=93064 RepID=A0A1L6J6G3_9SPHN|nr:flagellar hook-basal body complex protein FliE [Sphingomonas koreensis]APR51561.1 flagellar hook-basal body complex protein FliE [Sphingomonas koreensis]MDC7812729.1 flagellar hook-basal body complex protein FliE [Sphingomonas koreensis]RSU19418.1 flagellar hook-basal body complex protein FliE [Sphingomonas koreensis]RSU22551.1 flagellar hook-basal body complex protein FliE [Sphingomonas koreensis]RSU27489.1 flagellar hook-basal body complex protein FliE [Sphingomonas koreensis]